MSLILEALNKAEEHQGSPADYSAPQTYPQEKKTHTKGTFLLLIIIACLTSAIITLLIFNKPNLNNETTQLEPLNTRYSALTAAPTSQQADQKRNIEHSYKNQATASAANYRTLTTSTPNNTKPSQNEVLFEKGNLSQHREPSLHHLVKSTTRHEKIGVIPNNQKALNTISDNTEKHTTNVTAKSITRRVYSKADINNSAPNISHISTAPNLQLTDIKISVHMYSEIPAKRFVYINSTRYSEGSKINNDLLIDEITENGVILNSNNTLYRLPLKP